MQKIKDNNTITIKKVVYYILFPFIVSWVTLAFGIMKLGDGLYWLGNAMTGFKADKSIGDVYMN